MVVGNKFFINWLILTLLLILTAGCGIANPSAMADRNKGECVDISPETVGTITAERHYEYMINCIRMKHYANASSHYAIAGVQTWRDYLASPGAASKQRHQTELRKQLGKLNDKERKVFWDKLNVTLRDDEKLQQLCQLLEISESNHRSKILWHKAKNGYLHCEPATVF
ncbi:hypothetical protein [Winslowiella toletana]|uniref:hypothetical protein n=1 Tax=Winslowiella toletana TaxID=92490 RepID=UPI0028BEDD22|nr:hypothetical protein [Winslowiella toletana]WNN44523.1 hypothetical protein RIN69_00980 [Winslowiella toletana]